MGSNSDTKKKFFLFTAIAAVFGYLAGILTAPQSGKETREDIATKAGDIKDSSLDQLKSIETELSATIKNVQDKAGKLGAKAKEEFSEALLRAKDAQNKAKTVLKAVKDGNADNDDLDTAVKQSKQAIKSLAKYLKD